MRLPSKTLWCFVLLLVTSSSKSQENSMNGDKQSDNSTVQYDLLVSTTEYRNDEIKSTRCNLREKSVKNYNEMQYESNVNSTKNDHNNDSMQYEFQEYIKDCDESNQMSMESEAITEINDSMLQEIKNLPNGEDKGDFTSYDNSSTNHNNKMSAFLKQNEECENITCIQFCCPLDYSLTITGQCVITGKRGYFPDVYGNPEDEINQPFYVTIKDPCVSQGFGRSLLNRGEYIFLINGSLYQLYSKSLILPKSYCFAILYSNIYDVIVCTNQIKTPVYISACLLVSLPFLLLTFVIYSILTELQNIHGYILRAHVGSLFVMYATLYFGHQFPEIIENIVLCTTTAYIFYFFALSTFFWLNVTCFDIWWTFRKLRSRRTSVKEGKKKLVIYSIYAWGVALIITVFCAIIDNFFKIEQKWKPEMCVKRFWFGEDWARTIYFYVPIGATIVSNLSFFITTAITIIYQKIRTAHQLQASESQRHNENTQRFIMYLKLFIVMGISWVMEIIEWSIGADLVSPMVWYPFEIINALQGGIVFVIFVCRKKIMRQLQKRFGGKGCGPFKIPTYNESTISNTTSISTSGTMPMREIGPSNQQPVSPSSINSTRSTVP